MSLRDRWRHPSLAARFVGNTGWILTERVLHMVLTVVTTSLTMRYLGTAGSGMIDYGASYVSIFTILCKLGIDSVLVSEIVKGKRPSGELVGTTIGLRLMSAALSVGIIAGLVAVLKPGDNTLLFISVIQACSLLPVAFDTIDFWFQSQLKSRYTAVSKMIAFVLVCGFRLGLIALHADVTWFAFAVVLDALVVGACLLLFYRRTASMPLRFSFATARYLLPISAPFIVSAVLVTLYTQMDTLMIGSLVRQNANSAVGVYNAAAKVCNMWAFLPCAIIDSARPMVMEKKNVDEEAYLKRYRLLYAAVIWIGIASAVVITLCAEWIVLLIAGEAFTASIPVLQVLIWARVFAVLGITRSIWMVCEGHHRYVVVFAAVGAAVNFAVNFALIPQIGPMGAAIATLGTEFITAVVMPLCFEKTRPLSKIMGQAFLLRGLK